MSSIDPGAGVSAPAAPPPAAGAPAVPAPPADGSSGVPPTPSPESPGIRQLREQYEATKAKYEPYEKLGAKPEELSLSHQTYTKLWTEAEKLGQQLGLKDQVVRDYFTNDPADTIATLRQAVKERQSQPPTQADIERIAELKAKELMKPYEQERQERLQEREKAMDVQAEQSFDGQFDRELSTHFPNGLPEEWKNAFRGLSWHYLTNEDKVAYSGLRDKQDSSGVAPSIQKGKELVLKLWVTALEHEKGRIGAPPPPGNRRTPGTKTQSIDDIIANLGDSNVPMDKVFNGR